MSRRFAFAAALAALAVLISASFADAGKRDSTLTLVAYSTPKEAYGQLISAFQNTAAGNGVNFEQSYGASGEQSRAVLNGLKADLVALSLEPDVTPLVKAGIVDPSWSKDKYRGMVTDSVVVFVLRDGNPKKIKSWDDLTKKGVEIITPNPFTSGGARWNVMSAYGAWRWLGQSHAQAVAKLTKLWKNVSVQDSSARAALQTFTSGKGDVLLTYENEALFARLKGQNVQYLIPKQTILIENPIAVTKTSDNKASATAFVKFLRTPAAQRIFAKNGYRPILPNILNEFRSQFPKRPGVFKIDRLGGWAKVQKQFFDPNTGIMAKIQRSIGGSTG